MMLAGLGLIGAFARRRCGLTNARRAAHGVARLLAGTRPVPGKNSPETGEHDQPAPSQPLALSPHPAPASQRARRRPARSPSTALRGRRAAPDRVILRMEGKQGAEDHEIGRTPARTRGSREAAKVLRPDCGSQQQAGKRYNPAWMARSPSVSTAFGPETRAWSGTPQPLSTMPPAASVRHRRQTSSACCQPAWRHHRRKKPQSRAHGSGSPRLSRSHSANGVSTTHRLIRKAALAALVSATP